MNINEASELYNEKSKKSRIKTVYLDNNKIYVDNEKGEVSIILEEKGEHVVDIILGESVN